MIETTTATNYSLDDHFKQQQKFIRAAARKYEIPGHYLLNREDLAAEAYVMLVKVYQKGYTNFENAFRRSLINRFKNLRSWAFTQRRKGIEVDVDIIPEIVGDAGFKEIFDRENINHIRSMLSPRALGVFEVMLREFQSGDDVTFKQLAEYFGVSRPLISYYIRKIREEAFPMKA